MFFMHAFYACFVSFTLYFLKRTNKSMVDNHKDKINGVEFI